MQVCLLLTSHLSNRTPKTPFANFNTVSTKRTNYDEVHFFKDLSS